MPAAGDRFGPYEIVRAIGSGGMGEVYLARDTRLDRPAAVKILPADVAADTDRISRFEQEARLASSLNHPGIATVYDIGESNGVRFIAMEYVEGETLGQRLKRGRLPVAEVIEIGRQVGSALRSAHDRGVTHRDIKPDNIMMRPDGIIKVLDFGLAKLTTLPAIAGDAATQAAGLTRAGMVVGTLNYMSPEQARGLAVDQRTDLFSLGVVLFESLTARRPFAGATTIDVLAAIINHDAGPPSQYGADAPPELDRIVRKAMRKDPGDRYASAADFTSDLNVLRRDLDAATVTSIAAPPSRSWAQRLGNARAIIIVIAVGAALAYARFSPSRPTRAIESVAVLPFTHSGSDANMAYLADGLAETVTNNLSRLDGLKVMPRSTADRYIGTTDPRQAGRDLDVRAVLVGAVEPRGDLVAIKLELIDVQDGRQLWGQQYPRPLSDLVQLQSEISRDVAENLRPTLTGVEQARLRQLPTGNADAYQLYLRGRYYARQLTEDGLHSAVDYYSQALEKDPDFVQAHTGLAETYIMLGVDFSPAREAMPKAAAHAIRAIELQPDSAEAHAALGIINLAYYWDWKGAERELTQAHAIESPAIEAFSCALHYADPLGRNGDAIAALQSAVAESPQSLPSNLELGCASYYGRRYDQAIRQFRGTLALYPNHPEALFFLGRSMVQKGSAPEAITMLQEAKRTTSNWPPIVSELGYAQARTGHRAEAIAALAELRQQAKRRFVDSYLLAAVEIGLNDKDATFAALNQAVEERSGWLPWLKVEPKWDSLHGDPRFNALLQRVGLPVLP